MNSVSFRLCNLSIIDMKFNLITILLSALIMVLTVHTAAGKSYDTFAEGQVTILCQHEPNNSSAMGSYYMCRKHFG